MDGYDIYADIAKRTDGDIYIGVVGPVRTGKSTFIKQFMDSLVIPAIADDYDRERTRDEMPQSAAGKTVMTTEPKFIPDEAVEISVADNAHMRVKMVDCVGYMVDGAAGGEEDGSPRMVNTPWSEEPVAFEKAAETGTRKVIQDHSTIAVAVTCDGSIADIPRESYEPAENRVISELKAQGKPFAIILNSANPEKKETIELAYALEEKYGAPVALVNCLRLDAEDIRHIMELILLEFPVTEISVTMPPWVSSLEETHWLPVSLNQSVLNCAQGISRVNGIKAAFAPLEENENIASWELSGTDLSTGSAEMELKLRDDLYYRIMGELTGLEITSEAELISMMISLARTKKSYDRIAAALDDVNESGYGIVAPDIEDLTFEEPQIIKQAGGYGVKLRASAPSIHLMRANIETELSPMVGTEQQSEELVRYLMSEFEDDPKKIWDSNMFGKSLNELISEGLNTKLEHMPTEARSKLCETLERIINEGSGGLICIIL